MIRRPPLSTRTDTPLSRHGALPILVLVIFGIVFKFTEIGKVIEASSESPRVALSVGFDVPRIQTVLWGVCAALAALAGVLTASRTLVYPDMGDRTSTRLNSSHYCAYRMPYYA